MADANIVAGLTGAAALFGIYADLAYNTYSATNSSPQTTELFAGDRAGTLWKYVRLGGWQVFGLGLAGALLARNWWPLIGVAVVAVIMHAMYTHALAAGQARTAEGEETA